MSTTAVAKPALRNLGRRAWSICLGVSLLSGGLFAIWFKVNVLERRKRHYREFYETYDDDAAFESMRKAGVFKGFEV